MAKRSGLSQRMLIAIKICLVVTTDVIQMNLKDMVSLANHHSSSRCISSSKESLLRLNIRELNFTMLKSIRLLAPRLWPKLKIHNRSQSKQVQQDKQGLAIKQHIKTLFLVMKMCTGFFVDVIQIKTKCAVSHY